MFYLCSNAWIVCECYVGVVHHLCIYCLELVLILGGDRSFAVSTCSFYHFCVGTSVSIVRKMGHLFLQFVELRGASVVYCLVGCCEVYENVHIYHVS